MKLIRLVTLAAKCQSSEPSGECVAVRQPKARGSKSRYRPHFSSARLTAGAAGFPPDVRGRHIIIGCLSCQQPSEQTEPSNRDATAPGGRAAGSRVAYVHSLVMALVAACCRPIQHISDP
jgi:hypothetical protein